MSRAPLDAAFAAAMEAWIAEGLPIGGEPELARLTEAERMVLYGGRPLDEAIPGLAAMREDAALLGSHIHRKFKPV